MEKKQAIQINPVVLVAILVQIIFIILLVATFNIFQVRDGEMTMVDVEGLASEITDLPDFGKEDVEHDIYQVLANNTDGVIQKKGIYIRDGSLTNNYYEDEELHYVNFIADIPEMEQSYQIVSSWKDEEYNDPLYGNISGVMSGILCLDENELIYGEFDCKPFRGYMKYVIIDSLLGVLREEMGDDVMLTSEFAEDMEDYKVKIEYSDCDTMCYCRIGTEEERKIAKEKFESFINSLGFKMEDIPYYFDNCEGDLMWVGEDGTFYVEATD